MAPSAMRPCRRSALFHSCLATALAAAAAQSDDSDGPPVSAGTVIIIAGAGLVRFPLREPSSSRFHDPQARLTIAYACTAGQVLLCSLYVLLCLNESQRTAARNAIGGATSRCAAPVCRAAAPTFCANRLLSPSSKWPQQVFLRPRDEKAGMLPAVAADLEAAEVSASAPAPGMPDSGELDCP